MTGSGGLEVRIDVGICPRVFNGVIGECVVKCSTWKHGTLTATFRQPIDLLAVTNTAWQNEKAAGATSGDLRPIWLPAVDTLRNFLYSPMAEMKMSCDFLGQGLPGG